MKKFFFDYVFQLLCQLSVSLTFEKRIMENETNTEAKTSLKLLVPKRKLS